MATIKRSGNRIITKVVNGVRRVSCSCCEESECCMYSSEAFRNGDLSFEDLPDKIFFVNTQGQQFEINKVASPIYDDTTTGTPMTVYYGFVSDGIVLRGDGGGWGYWADFSPPDDLFECLITYYDGTASSWPYADDFADTYTVTTPFSSGTVTRFALCNWAGLDGNGCLLQLIYGGFGGDPETEPAESALKWSVSFNKFESPTEGQPEVCIESYGRLKSGPQNSPVGTYNISYATEGPQSATVS